MPTHNTKWFSSDFAGAPVCSGQAGALIAVLDACLVDGFNLLTLDSLVVAGNVATATKNGHGYKQYQIVEIAGASPAGLNGLWRVTAVTSNTFTFTTSGISDQTATGTITCKTPGAGWEKPFTATNTAVYRSQSARASGYHAVRVTDTGTTTATCLAAEEFTDVNTPVNSISTFYLPKSSTADSTARAWTVVVDDRTIYPMISWSGGRRDCFSWGDLNSIVGGDGHAFQVRAPTASSVAALGYRTSLGYASLTGNSQDNLGYISRDYSQTVGAAACRLASLCAAFYNFLVDSPGLTAQNSDVTGAKTFSLSGSSFGLITSGTAISYSWTALQAPSPADGGLHFSPVFVFENVIGSAGRLRGTMRGLLHALETRPLTSDVIILPGVEGVSGGLILGVRTQNEVYAATAGARAYPETHIAFSLGEWD